METKSLGAGARVARIGIGTWGMGEDPARAADEVRAIQAAVDLGLTLIDTAEMYGEGGAEEVVGRAIASVRERVFLVTKVYPWNASYRGILQAAERSLRRLETDVIDLYLLHWAGEHPIEETMRGMEELVDRGWVRFAGVSNLAVPEMEAAREALTRVPLACNQLLYHLEDRSIERRELPYCLMEGVGVMAYSPFGHGHFPEPGSAKHDLLASIGARYGKTPRQVALNWLTRRPHVVAIPKAVSPAHLEENAGAAGWDLTAEDAAAIDRAFPLPEDDGTLHML
ncbi:aldo/keto reductase [Limnochorda pilosa]|uniref:NADP-dependent oxidoreductase domain-containing protein n=1 Tax=Limnochorda pilosa TaxID=1555112 RepID=A0A0K2SHI0_LIMPI|nr:aldo/keto reductase [Limnochorda pilosa]BAS26550.1 hypothetical protein LIP_0693 [Limnochorda pilosa]